MNLDTITSKIFIEILEGKHHNDDSKYNKYYTEDYDTKEGCKIIVIRLENLIFLDKIEINYLNCKYSVSIRNCKFEKDFSFLSSTFKNFSFSKVTSNSSINFRSNTSLYYYEN